jgi:sporulation protein YlmC with PRC-barrel domain
MRFSQAKGHKVVASSTATTVGKVSELLVDPVTRSVVAVRLKKSEHGDYLRWADMVAFGSDAVTVTDDSSLGDGGPTVRALAGKTHRVLGKRVLTDGGDELGTVDDVEFDADTGTLTSLLLGSAGKGGDPSDVAASRLLGIGSYAVVVREQS